MHCIVYRGKNSLVLGIRCEVLERKNTQFLERELYPTSNLLDPCVWKEYGSLISEMYSVRRNPRLYYIALGKIQHSTHKCCAFKEIQIDC